MWAYWEEILIRSSEHLILVAISMTVAILIGIPLGILITRKPKLARPIIGVANAIQTIPSLAIFGFLLTVPLIGGIGKTPAIVALILYALLPLIRNTYTGIKNVDPAIREAAKGMGMSDRQILFQVEIPLATGIIIAGVRVATVICVGIATIGAAIGAGGLGEFIFRGLSTVNNDLIVAGAIPAALIALGLDFILGWLENRLTKQRKKKKIFDRQFALILGLLTFAIVVLMAISSQQTPQTTTQTPQITTNQITIGSKNFTEQLILGEILAREIEAKTNLQVDRKLNLGGTFIAHKAVVAGEIDGYVEYTGTAFTGILERKPITNPQEVYKQVKQAYSQKFNLEVMQGLGFENTFAILIRRQDAEKLNLKTISEVAKYTPQWKAGFGYEFLDREDGFPNLAKTYNLKFSQPPQAMDLGLTYRALAEKQVDLIAGDSTNGLIAALNLFMLEDDRKYFPPYQAVPIFNKNTLKKHPEVAEAIAQLAGKISAEEMRQMNYQVDSQSRRVEEVAENFLKSEGLLSSS